jgi:voltage-gated potassium channel Kch
MTGVTDTMPPIDITLMMWTALMLLFIKAAIKRHMLYLVTIGTGFFVQATILALIFFK